MEAARMPLFVAPPPQQGVLFHGIANFALSTNKSTRRGVNPTPIKIDVAVVVDIIISAAKGSVSY
jgi:hypothetical protein